MSPTTFSDLSGRELGLVAEALKGTWLALFSRVSKACRDASIFVAGNEAAVRRLNVCDLVRRVELAAWALEQGCPRTAPQWTMSICTAAARGGYLETLKWLRANGCECNLDSMCFHAALGGHLEVLKWARANGCRWNEETCSA